MSGPVANADTLYQNCSTAKQTTVTKSSPSTAYQGVIAIDSIDTVGYAEQVFGVFGSSDSVYAIVVHDISGNQVTWGIGGSTGYTTTVGSTLSFTIQKSGGLWTATMSDGFGHTSSRSNVNVGSSETAKEWMYAGAKSPCIGLSTSVSLTIGSMSGGSLVSAFPYYQTNWSASSFEVDTI